MPNFQVHDTVVLIDQTSFVGSVEKTSQFDPGPLDECLIIAHTKVPSSVIHTFVSTGSPPQGYVFVRFASQEKGSSLVAESDLILIDRILDLGDVVKLSTSQLTGTVVNVESSYVLDPIWLPKLTGNDFAARPANQISSRRHVCDTLCNKLDVRLSHPSPHRLIHDVPFEELKRAQDFVEEDYVIEQDWLGIVDEAEILVVLRLEDGSVVVVAQPEDLYIPIPDYSKPLVSLPEYDGIMRPDLVIAAQGWGNMIPAEELQSGQFVVTDPKNIKRGRWLRGSYDTKVKPQGHILMVKSRRLTVEWLMCNAFTPEDINHISKPGNCVPYENLDIFLTPQEIRRDKRVALYDPSKHPAYLEDRTRAVSKSADHSRSTASHKSVSLSSNFNVGQRVRFRDPAGAAVKYAGQEIGSVVHGMFERIDHKATLGYDVNEFDVVHSRQLATVRWQDGTVTQHSSTALLKVALFESDYMPADIVVAREGMKQRQHSNGSEHPLLDFNEMTVFTQQHDLLPSRVGIVQSVNPRERVASIRWFAHPAVRLTQSGNGLGADSRFGPVGHVTEDVSLYEIMSFGGLFRKLRDIVALPPCMPVRKALVLINTIAQEYVRDVGASITTLSQIPDTSPSALLEFMQHNAHLNILDAEITAITETEHYKSHRSLDWVGEICELRTDGLVVVRVNTANEARDVLIEHDQILAFVDIQGLGFDYNDDPMDVEDDDDSYASETTDDSLEVLAELVEYEGGQRLDDDPGDDNWESEEETDSITTMQLESNLPSEAETRGTLQRARQLDQSTKMIPSTIATDAATRPHKRPLTAHLPPEEPAAFLCLDQEPPADQFRASEPPSRSTAFLKRIAKEHRILTSSLPKHEIYVRTFESRLDLLRCLIIGPLDTPYEHAPFLIDLHLGSGFPREPPTARFHSWTSGMGRINPNLYEEGKICLSLLGTWPGKSEDEGWTEKATLLQLLVSLQGLVFVKAPFYNEAGYEGYAETQEYKVESLQYSEKAYIMSRNFVKHAISCPIPGMEDVLAWIYLPRRSNESYSHKTADRRQCVLSQVISRSQALIRRSEELRGPSKQLGGEDDDHNDQLLSGDGKSDDDTTVFLSPLSVGAVVMLRKTIESLSEILEQELQALNDTAMSQEPMAGHSMAS
ncbi:hypothetical protein LTR05_005610 [Lithohypha guttulata]|uniref:UBC core domain-containing protein n=1 Tax=Lithohypha guttulata TaxID=1690604 RepID=A0AAN7SYG2_9EURO|nr:hypothetical protein LTR05_005610 [Lithohypha guttulata]